MRRLNKYLSPSRLLAYMLGMIVFHTSCATAALPNYGLQTHGFFSQAYLKTDVNNMFGQSNRYGSIDFREIGLNASIRPFSKLKASTQIIHRDAGAAEEQLLLLDFALVDYQLLSTDVFSTGLRIGRIKNPMGLYNDTRDVAFTRPGIILPQSIYFDRVRDLALSSDGIQNYIFYTSSLFDLQIQIAAGYPRLGKNSEISLFSQDLPGELRASPSYLARLSLELFNNRLKLSYSDIGLYVDYIPTETEDFTDASLFFTPKIFSAELSMEKLVLTGEYALRKFRFTNLGAYLPNSTQTGESFYLQLAYFLTRNIKVITRYDVTYLNRNDRSGIEFEALSSGSRSAYSQYAKDISLGIQWFINRSWVIMLEQHQISGTAWLPVQDNPDTSGSMKDWWMFSGLVSYRF